MFTCSIVVLVCICRALGFGIRNTFPVASGLLATRSLLPSGEALKAPGIPIPAGILALKLTPEISPEFQVGLSANGVLAIERAYLGAVTVKLGLQWTRGRGDWPELVSSIDTVGKHITRNTGVVNKDLTATLLTGVALKLQSIMSVTLAALATTTTGILSLSFCRSCICVLPLNS